MHVLSDSEEEDSLVVPAAAPPSSTSLLRKRKSMAKLDEPAKQRLKTEVPCPRRVANELGQPSSGDEHVASNAEFESIVPDSQSNSLATELGLEGAIAVDAEATFAIASPASVTASSRSLPRASSPAASSDVEICPLTRSFSNSNSNFNSSHSRILGPVPVSRPQAFARALLDNFSQISVPASSQADPIEDPDSPPPRRPLGPAALRRTNASPVPSRPSPILVPLVKPPRPQLDLVRDEDSRRMPSPHSDSDAEDDEENQPSSGEVSYISQPVAVGAGKVRAIVEARGPFTLVRTGGAIRGGGGIGRGGSTGIPAAAITIPLAKIPFFRPPTPDGGDDDVFGYGGRSGGTAVAARVAPAPIVEAVATQAVSQSASTASDLYEQTMRMVDPNEVEELKGKYEKPDLPAGGNPNGAVGAAAGAEPTDAGEGGDGGRSRSPTSNEGYPSSSSNNQFSQQQQQRSDGQAISRSGSSNGHGGSSGGGGGSAGYYPGYGGYPPYGAPYGGGGYGYPPPPSSIKRELDYDSADDSSKKARKSQRPTPEPEHEHRLPPPMAPMYHYPAPYPGYPPYPPPPHGYPFPPPMPGYHQPPPFIPVPSYSPPLPQTNQKISPSLARVLGPTTTGPNPVPLAAPQAQNPAPPSVIAPSPTGATTPVGYGSPVPSPAVAAVRSPLRQRSQSPAAALKSPSIARAATFAAATGAAAVNSSAAVSRNASPAPGGGSNLDGLINLVLASPHIEEADQTKAEIVRFLRDPKAYICTSSFVQSHRSKSSSASSPLAARPDQPLSQTPHWAFELRRMTHEGVDKTDFIIIHSGTGTHQLKRVARAQATFDFARRFFALHLRACN